MDLTTRRACELYAAASNLELPPAAFTDLLSPEVEWVRKDGIIRGRGDVQAEVEEYAVRDAREGLRWIELVSGFIGTGGEHFDCSCAVSVRDPCRYSTLTTFRLTAGRVSAIFTYHEWIDPAWPHPQRLHDAVTRLRGLGIRVGPVD